MFDLTMFSDRNAFSEKAMPLVSEICDRFLEGTTSDDYRAIGDATEELYDGFCSGLTDSQKDDFDRLEDERFLPKVCCAEREGFTGGFYLGFHLAMELLKGGARHG